MYIYGKDYIKYLNDDSIGHLTYDQWKTKNSQHRSSNGSVEAPRYTEGSHSQGSFNKNSYQ